MNPTCANAPSNPHPPSLSPSGFQTSLRQGTNVCQFLITTVYNARNVVP